MLDKIDKRMGDLIFRDECYKTVGACFEVYEDKGCGFLESVYQECLEIELELQGIPFVPQPALLLSYKHRPLQQKYQPDLICFETVIVEIKAVSALADEHRAQVLNYLRATGHELGLLVNFGHFPKLEWERTVAQRGRYSPNRLEDISREIDREMSERRES